MCLDMLSTSSTECHDFDVPYLTLTLYVMGAVLSQSTYLFVALAINIVSVLLGST